MTAQLYYSGKCPKCRFIARVVEALSFGRTQLVAMEIDDAWTFYTQRYPQAQGYPVLVTPQGAAYGARVYGATISWVMRSWMRR